MGKLINRRNIFLLEDDALDEEEDSCDADEDIDSEDAEVEEIFENVNDWADNDDGSENADEDSNSSDEDDSEYEVNDEDEDDEDNYNNIEDENGEEYKRRYRHKRRVRNQIISYSVVIVFVLLLTMAGFYTGQRIIGMINEHHSMQALSMQEELEEQPSTDLVIEAPPEIEEATLEEQIEEVVNTCIAAMPLEDKVAGLFIVAPEAITGVSTVIQSGEGTQNALNQYAVGGLIYSARNILDREQLTRMLSDILPMSKYPIFLAIEEEGGDYSVLAESGIEIDQVDNMSAIGGIGDTSLAYESGLRIGSYLSGLGFNLNLAPVADVVEDTQSSIVGEHSFGDNASVNADMVSNMVLGMEEAGVSACLKHFPGIGSVEKSADTQEGVPTTDKTLEEMQSSDFLPFQSGIEAGVDMIMVSNVIASALDSNNVPNSMSVVVVDDILRQELGYNGIVITDELNQEEIVEHYTADQAAVAAIEAGVDMLLLPEDFEIAYEGLLVAVQDGTISEERIDESLRRIYRVKFADRLR